MDFASTTMVATLSPAVSAVSSGNQPSAVGFPAMLAMLEQRDLGAAAPVAENPAQGNRVEGNLVQGSPVQVSPLQGNAIQNSKNSRSASGEIKDKDEVQPAGIKRKSTGEKKAVLQTNQQGISAMTVPFPLPSNPQVAMEAPETQGSATVQSKSAVPSVNSGFEIAEAHSSGTTQAVKAGPAKVEEAESNADGVSAVVAQAGHVSDETMPALQAGDQQVSAAVPPIPAAAEPEASRTDDATSVEAAPQLPGGNLPAVTASVQPQASKGTAADVATSTPAHSEPNGPKEAPKSKTPSASKPGFHTAVDPKVQTAMSAVVAATEAQATESHSSHADLKLPTLKPGTKLSKDSAKHGISDPGIDASPDRPATSSAHETKKDAEVSSTRVAEPAASPNAAPIKAETANTPSSASAAVSSVLAATSSSNNPTKFSSSEPAQAAPGTAAPHAAPDLPYAGTIVNSATLLEQMGKAEIKMGVRVGEFGNVEIRTQMDHQQVRAEISVSHQELGHALAAEMPSLQQRLRDHDVPLTALNLTGQGAGNPGDPRNNERQDSGFTAPISSISAVDSSPIGTAIEQADSRSGLDIHI